MEFLRETKMRIHPKLASGLFVFIYSGVILIIDKIFCKNLIQTKFFFISLLIGTEITYLFCKKKFYDD